MAFFALLSPQLTWTIEQLPSACRDLQAPDVSAQTLDMNEFCPLGVTRKRVILSNRQLQLPEKRPVTSLGDKLGFSSKDKATLQVFNAYNYARPLNQAGFPLIATIPLRIGTNLKRAKQMNINQLQGLVL